MYTLYNVLYVCLVCTYRKYLFLYVFAIHLISTYFMYLFLNPLQVRIVNFVSNYDFRCISILFLT